ncbi:MAG TPA: MBL fold metallo-hydrolase [Candidatus Nanoarchaeia archaeon]|nr:MBL fold metallo-hydrolase [Candidatus Nanoarchaeia archaeon]
MTTILGIEIEHLPHAAVRVTLPDERVLYFDPFKLAMNYRDAAMVFISHEHFDHCSIEDLKKICTPQTVVFCPADCQNKLSSLTLKHVTLVRPGQKIKIGEILIETVPAYNTNKKFHLKEQEWVGYIVTVPGAEGPKRVYHCGDTDYIPEMNQLKDIDIACMGVGGTYGMTAEEAAKAVNSFKPKVAIPMHYGVIVGTPEDGKRFKELVQHSRVEVI